MVVFLASSTTKQIYRQDKSLLAYYQQREDAFSHWKLPSNVHQLITYTVVKCEFTSLVKNNKLI